VAGLTAKQEAFAAGLARGMTQIAAYREAYPNARAWKDSAAAPKASTLAASGKIQARLAELGARAAAANEFTVAEHLRTLVELRDEARGAEQFSAAIKAEELRGKCAGFYTERVEHNLGDIGPNWRVLLRKAGE
jgi:hypothetical protein